MIIHSVLTITNTKPPSCALVSQHTAVQFTNSFLPVVTFLFSRMVFLILALILSFHCSLGENENRTVAAGFWTGPRSVVSVTESVQVAWAAVHAVI